MPTKTTTKKTSSNTRNPAERARLVKKYQELMAGGMTAQAAAKKLDCSYITLRSWLRRIEEKKAKAAGAAAPTKRKLKHGSTLTDKTLDKLNQVAADQARDEQPKADPKPASKRTKTTPKAKATAKAKAERATEAQPKVTSKPATEASTDDKLEQWVAMRQKGMSAQAAAEALGYVNSGALFKKFKAAQAAGQFKGVTFGKTKRAPRAKAAKEKKAKASKHAEVVPADPKRKAAWLARKAKAADKARAKREAKNRTRCAGAIAVEISEAADRALNDMIVERLLDQATDKVEATSRRAAVPREEARDMVRTALRMALAEQIKAGA